MEFGLDSTDGPQVINEYVYKERQTFSFYIKREVYTSQWSLHVQGHCISDYHLLEGKNQGGLFASGPACGAS